MNWSDPNGAWSLYVFDDSVGDAGIIASGWSLKLTTLVTVGPVVDLAVGLTVPVSLDVGGTLTNTISVTNSGPDAATGVVLANPLPTGDNFISASLSQGSYFTSADGRQVTCNLGSLPAGGSANVTLLTTPSLAGSLVTSVSVEANEEDLNPANNTAQTTTTVSVPTTLSGAIFTNGYFQLTVTCPAGFRVTFVQGSTNLTSWVSLSTNTNTTGTFTFTDITTAGSRTALLSHFAPDSLTAVAQGRLREPPGGEEPARMKVLGLTGGIGMGKSTAAQLLRLARHRRWWTPTIWRVKSLSPANRPWRRFWRRSAPKSLGRTADCAAMNWPGVSLPTLLPACASKASFIPASGPSGAPRWRPGGRRSSACRRW